MVLCIADGEIDQPFPKKLKPTVRNKADYGGNRKIRWKRKYNNLMSLAYSFFSTFPFCLSRTMLLLYFTQVFKYLPEVRWNDVQDQESGCIFKWPCPAKFAGSHKVPQSIVIFSACLACLLVVLPVPPPNNIKTLVCFFFTMILFDMWNGYDWSFFYPFIKIFVVLWNQVWGKTLLFYWNKNFRYIHEN